MDEPTANQFISSLVKSVQALCNGYIDFSSTVEVVGHIHLNIDRKVKLDYVLTEEVSKAVGEDATLFSSHSYHSKPPGGLISEDLTEKPESALTPKSSNTNSSRRKSHHVPRVDDSESFSFTSISRVTSHTHTINNSLAAVETKEKIDTSYSDNSDISHESTSVLNTEKESWRTVSNSVPSSQDRRRKSSCGLITSAAKHRRTSREDLKSEQPDPLLVQIKEEPEDDLPVYQGSVVETSAEDLAAPDFSSVVMESLDHVGQNEVTSFMTGTHGHHMQLKPYPVLLHATPELNLTAVSQPVPGLPSNTPPVPSTSTDVTVEGEKRKAEVQMVQQYVQTAYTRLRPVKGKSWSKHSPKASPHKRTKASPAAEKTARSTKSKPHDKSHYLEYTVEDMNEAIELIHGGMSVIDAAYKYGIPRATLFNRSRDGCKTHSGRCSEVFLRTHVGTELTKKRFKSTYTAKTMEEAIDSIHKGMPVIDAAILYDIPRASLFIRSGKGCPTHKGRCSTVANNGKLKRTKVSRFRYLQLMEEKNSGKTVTSSSKGSSGKKSAKASGTNVEKISPVPDDYNPQVKLLKIPVTRTAQRDTKKGSNDEVEMLASELKNVETGASEPFFEMSTSEAVGETVSYEPIFETSPSEIPEPSIEIDISESGEPDLEMNESEPSEPVFETLSGSVVKIEKTYDHA